MSDRRRRPGDEFADERPWSPDEDLWPGGRYRPGDDGEPAWPSPGEPPGAGRRGRHSAAPPPFTAPPDPYPYDRPGRPGGPVAPPPRPADPGLPPLPRQPDRGYPPPGAAGAPNARFPAQPGGYPPRSPADPGRPARYPGPGGRPAPGAPRSASADGYPGDGYPGDGYRGDGYPVGADPRRPGARDGYGARETGEDYEDFWGESDQPGGWRRGRAGGVRGRAAGGRDRPGGGRGRAGGRGSVGGRGGRDRRDDGGGGDGPDRPRSRRRGRYAALIALLVIVVPLAVLGFFAYRVIAGHFFPADYSGPGTGQVIVQVRSGDTATVVGDRLYALGVVASSRAFVNAAEASPKASSLQPGFYRMHKHMNATLAFNLLLNPKSRVQLTVTIPEGLRATQIIAALAHGSGIPLGDYRRALRDTGALGLPSYARGQPEGYLFPATYPIQPNMTATSVLQAMVKAFNTEAAGVGLTQAAARVHLSPAQVIVVASLAQAEGGRVSDFPKIVRVIYNRLHAGMKLQFDSTVFYGLHTYGTSASTAQLRSTSPYNTYRYAGLPPGPIDSPGDAAIRAALHPASGNWLYFITVNLKTRQTIFTGSYAYFQQLQARYGHN